jgi:hypothetical protein
MYYVFTTALLHTLLDCCTTLTLLNSKRINNHISQPTQTFSHQYLGPPNMAPITEYKQQNNECTHAVCISTHRQHDLSAGRLLRVDVLDVLAIINAAD